MWVGQGGERESKSDSIHPRPGKQSEIDSKRRLRSRKELIIDRASDSPDSEEDISKPVRLSVPVHLIDMGFLLLNVDGNLTTRSSRLVIEEGKTKE